MAAVHKLTDNFDAFFRRLNPSPTYVRRALSAQSTIRSLIEDVDGPAGDLRVRCFIQGSYRRHTAIHTINDVDIVALCSVSYKTTANRETRDQIFVMVADSIAADSRYTDKIRYDEQSMCVKVELASVKVEVLPALRKPGARFEHEPFWVFDPEAAGADGGEWTQTYAREHQRLLSEKNDQTDGSFIPMVKVLKHLRATRLEDGMSNAASFHLECLLYALRGSVYAGSTGECIEQVLRAIAGFDAEKAGSSGLRTPCGEKLVFSGNEWTRSAYRRFHEAGKQWHEVAAEANAAGDEESAIKAWKCLLGDSYFPREVGQ
ncbi:MAG TPA: hypothetical protein VM221_11820 [Armatimonadota bacterium]|nr:hypothetical protein [Armatimonadota bacterium]